MARAPHQSSGAEVRGAVWPFRRPYRRLLYLVGLAVLLLLLLTGWNALRRPRWFAPMAVDYAQLGDDKRELVDLLDNIGSALNGDQPITLRLEEAQLNRWLTARSELPDVHVPDLGPLDHPQINLLDGNRARVAAQASWAGFRPVASCLLHADVTPDRVRLRIDAVHAGTLPLPRRMFQGLFDAQLDSSRQSTHNEVVWRNDFVWPNGKRRFHIEYLKVEAGAVEITLTPAPR